MQLHDQSLVSIVTPSYNQGEYIEKTILSVLCQDYSNIEYVVVDAMSTDCTHKVLKKYAGRLTKVIREPDDGQADAIDKGFRQTSGEIMGYINSDDCYASAAVVGRVVEIFNERPDVDVVYGCRKFIDDKGFFSLSQPFKEFDAETLKKACYIPQECVFWRRAIYEKAGCFVDRTLQFAMDYDLWLRFIDAEAKFLAVNETFGLFRWYPGQKSQQSWLKHGVPEIRKLQKRHLGRGLSEKEMTENHDRFLFGISRHKNPESWQDIRPIWIDYMDYKCDWLKCCPLDIWVFHGSYARQNKG